MMDGEIQKLLRPFEGEAGPASGRNPEHCDECRDADSILRNLLPSNITYEDITKRAWAFSFLSETGLRWLMPGIVRAALDRDQPDASAIFDLFSQRYDEVFSDEQWIAILSLADFCVLKGWMTRQDADAVGPGKYMGPQEVIQGERAPV